MSTLKESVSLHAHALCNIVALVNAYFSQESHVVGTKSKKLSNSQALELVAKIAGKNTYKGLLTEIQDTETVKPHFELKDCKGGLDELFDTRDNYHMTLITAIEDYLYLLNGVLHPLDKQGLAYKMAVAVAYTKVCPWHSIATVFLQENLFNPINTPNHELSLAWNLPMLFMANKLCAFVNEYDTVESFEERVEEEELQEVNHLKNAPKDLYDAIKLGTSVMDNHLFVYYQDFVMVKRSVPYYIAAKHGGNKALPLPVNFKKRLTKDDKAQVEMLESMYSYMLHNGFENYDDPSPFFHPCKTNFPVYIFDQQSGKRKANSLFLSMIKQTSHLSSRMTNDVTESWRYICESLNNLPKAIWDDCVVNRHVAVMDYIRLFFTHNADVEHVRLNFKDFYINEAGLYKYDGAKKVPFYHPKTGEHYTLSANEFSLFLNCFISDILDEQRDGYYQTQYGHFMGLASFQIAFATCEYYQGSNELKRAINSI